MPAPADRPKLPAADAAPGPAVLRTAGVPRPAILPAPLMGRERPPPMRVPAGTLPAPTGMRTATVPRIRFPTRNGGTDPLPRIRDLAHPPGGGEQVDTGQFAWTGDKDGLDAPARDRLTALARRLAEDGDLHLHVVPFLAIGEGELGLRTRSAALARGETVRRFLVAAGAPPRRVSVMAVGADRDGGPDGRIALALIRR